MINFDSFPKIDAHFHAFIFEDGYLKIAKDNNLRYININTDTDIFPPMNEQEKIAIDLALNYPDYFSYIASFSMNGWNEGGWTNKIIEGIKQSLKLGSVGIKIWKNIGMELIKNDGSYLMIDDPLFYPIFEFLSVNNIPVVGHLGEPLNCWLPLSEMTTKRNRAYFETYPQYHAYLHPEIPSHYKQIEARDNVLNKFPDLVFVGAHLGSLEWNINELAKRLEAYPNFAVDLSSRLGHVQLQSQKNYDEVRHFFIKYADRILYGTDAYNNIERLQNSIINDWKYLANYNKCSSTEFDGIYIGLQLPEEVLYKIYYANARKYYNLLKPKN